MAGSLHLCAGQISSIEAAAHAVDSLFQQEEILLVDASNAFNPLIFSLLYTTSIGCVTRWPQPSSTPTGTN